MKPTDTTRILTDLIALDTTSRNSNLVLIDYVQSLLADHAIESELTFDAGKNKANLFATLGRSDAPGIVLSGHTDVVPVDGQAWDTDPFAAEVVGDKLYGRGSCDMKGFIAICLAHIDRILKAKLNTPVHFAFSYDEEAGYTGYIEELPGANTQGKTLALVLRADRELAEQEVAAKVSRRAGGIGDFPRYRA